MTLYERAQEMAQERGFRLYDADGDGRVYLLFRLLPDTGQPPDEVHVHTFHGERDLRGIALAMDKGEDMESGLRERVAAEAAAKGFRLVGKDGAWKLVPPSPYEAGVSGLRTLGAARARIAEMRPTSAAPQSGPPAVVDVPAVAVDTERTEGAALADQLYGDREYDRDVLIAETRHFLGQGVMAMLEAGRRLIQLKEHEDRGNWLPALEKIGIGHASATRMMRAARKFLAGPNIALVQCLGSVSQVYELAMEDDDDLAELRDGGTIAGVTLDDIQRMPPSELRKTLRAERQERRERELAQTERALDKERHIQRLQDKLDGARSRARALARPGSIPADEQLQELHREIAGYLFDAKTFRTSVRSALLRLRGHAEQRAARELEHPGQEEGPLPPLADRHSPAVVTVGLVRELASELLDAIGAVQTVVEDELAVPLATERQALDDVQPWDRPITPDAPDSE